MNGIASCNGQNDIHNKLYKSILYKTYMNLIKHNLELIALIKNIKLFLDYKQLNLNCEHSFGGIYKVLREIWLFEDELKTRIFGKLQIFGGISFVNKLNIKVVNSISIFN